MKITASEIVKAISLLPRNRAYPYVSTRTSTLVCIESVEFPEGPIRIKRFDPRNKGSKATAKEETMSSNMIWRIANALIPGNPINFDRVLGASYNTRSALEALLAHTPQFYSCLPGRIEVVASSTDIRRGHKHLVWQPDKPHEQGVIKSIDTEVVISEIPSVDIVYEALTLPESRPGIDIEVQRRHAQIQIALLMIGQQLGFRTWIAQNDRGIMYKDKRLAELPGVVPALRDERLLMAYGEAAEAAMFIDCVWFRNHHFMPAVLEVEHSTGVTSGLNRMLTFYNALPRFETRWVVVAPDEDRQHVLSEASTPQFLPLKAKYFPYSAVEELYSLCQKRKLRGVNDEFLDCFMEDCAAA